MINKHGTYVLKVEGDIFYCGYLCDRPLEDRLREHIYSATHPTRNQKLLDAVRGTERGKHKIINTALKEGWSITIEPLTVNELHETIDEEYDIIKLKQDGHCITNLIAGSIWQPYVLVNGELVATTSQKIKGGIKGKQTKEDARRSYAQMYDAIKDLPYNANSKTTKEEYVASRMVFWKD